MTTTARPARRGSKNAAAPPRPVPPAPPPQAPAPAPAPEAGLATKLSQWGAVIAPTTVVTAMLLYFGYIATRARFAYFGVYLDLTDLSSRDLVLYGIEVLYLPVALLLLAALVVGAGHFGATRLTGRAGLMAAGLVGLTGVLLSARAVIGLVVAHVSRDEAPGSTALALAAGPVLIAYAAGLAARARPPGAWYAESRRLRRAGVAAIAGLAVTGLFWAGTSFAWRLGEGRAYDDALRLPDRPEVVLDTGERLVDLPPYVRETPLAAEPGATYHYRYRGLRLLIQAGGRLFLVPEHWTVQGRTLILPYDESVRLQVIPRPGA